MSEIVVEPNFIKIKSGIINQSYCYIDSMDYTIDEVLANAEVPVYFLPKDFKHPEHKYLICFLKCRKKFKDKMEKEIFPKLHNKMLTHFGEDYQNFCVDFMNQILYEFDGKDISEVFCEVKND